MRGQLRLKLEHAADHSRSRFIVSEPNREAVKSLEAWPAGRSGALALIGPPGVGKTHLATIWADRTDAQRVRLDEPHSQIDHQSGPLLLEDADRAPHGEALFHLLNRAQAPDRCLLITGRTAPGTWAVQVPDLRSRLNALPVILLKEPDDAILRGVLLKLFQERNIRPPADLIAYMLRRMERSTRAAQSLVATLDEAASAQSRAVSRLLAREILHDEADEDNGAVPP